MNTLNNDEVFNISDFIDSLEIFLQKKLRGGFIDTNDLSNIYLKIPITFTKNNEQMTKSKKRRIKRKNKLDNI